jgi:hypothetical protein
LIGGLGLSVFALSTFTPTQCFGIMMFVLLIAALVGDLILLPALLAGPLGKFLCPKVPPSSKKDDSSDALPVDGDVPTVLPIGGSSHDFTAESVRHSSQDRRKGSN